MDIELIRVTSLQSNLFTRFDLLIQHHYLYFPTLISEINNIVLSIAVCGEQSKDQLIQLFRDGDRACTVFVLPF